MSRSVTFKGNPLTLVGDEVQVGQPAPGFELTNGTLDSVTAEDLKGKPTLISVVPSLDTPVCQVQTKRFNEEVAALGDQINAVTVSLDLPFAQVTSCAFGGENLDELYITSAVETMDEQALAEQPLAGALVQIDPGVRGVPAHAYAG